ncbi:MAG: aldo/keto reductase family protein [Candidatus Eremiobacteraeota bacterium]|nr:aldo/keto reductase family protein [Candidatus Eremiobacteraeota bacterium]MBC5826701.1 aldo/keto reductase family protein [Candidatus Eremiobacteraeota bacterium]
MHYRNVGRSGIKVSAVGLGSWLTYGGSVDEETSKACIHRAFELGVNFFDTANAYARGRAEEIVASALASYARDSYVLATKVYFPMGSGPNDRGLSRKHVFEQCHRSLRRLRAEYIDLYQCHRYDEHTPLEETCAVMSDLIHQGKVLYWGVSEWSADQIAHAVSLCRAVNWPEPISNQPEYNALWRNIEARILPTCAALGLGNVVWSPLAMGVLSGKYESVSQLPAGTRAAGSAADMMEPFLRQDILDAVARLRPIAAAHGCTMSQLALAWCLRSAQVSSVIVGATKIEHVEDNAAAADIRLSADAISEIDRTLDAVAYR